MSNKTRPEVQYCNPTTDNLTTNMECQNEEKGRDMLILCQTVSVGAERERLEKKTKPEQKQTAEPKHKIQKTIR